MKIPDSLLGSPVPNNRCAGRLEMLGSIILVCICVTSVRVGATLERDGSKPQTLMKVKRFWGVPDTTATIGKLFNYSVPEDAFTGQVDQYEVLEAGELTLPRWLHFNHTSNSFLGVPTFSDLGQYFISIKAVGPSNSDGHLSIGKDVFSIEVVPELVYPSHVVPLSHLGAEFFKCSQGESVTVAAVFVNSTFDDLSSTQRVELVSKMASFAGVSINLLKVTPCTKEWKITDKSAMLAGAGTMTMREKSGVVFQWQVGCSGHISPLHRDRIIDLELVAGNGSLERILGSPVIGWNVVDQQQFPVQREKREVNMRGTPILEVPLPTNWPTFSEIDGPEKSSEDTEVPEPRIIPTMASPTLPLPSHHHRHHHGEKFSEGEHELYRGGIQQTPSPTQYYHHLPTTRLYYPMVTPVIQPERPSIYVYQSVTEDLQSSRIFPDELTPAETYLFSPTSSFITHLETDTSSVPIKLSHLTPAVVTSIVHPSKSYVPVIPKNFKPTVQNHIKKLQAYVGQIWNFEIPSDIFYDYEDGDTRNLKLILLPEEKTTILSSWIQFDPEKQKLYALPLVDNIGKHNLKLEAMDSHGMSTFDLFEIQVWENPSQYGLHHEFTMTFKYEKWKYPVDIDWQIEVVKRILELFGDEDYSHLTVLSVTQEPTSITWTNFSLPNYPCPKEAIEELMKKLVSNDKGHPSKSLKKVMKPDFNIQKLHINYLGICHLPPSPTPSSTNLSPALQSPIDSIKIQVGDILEFFIPKNTFYDSEDGDTRNLKLSFLTSDSKELSESSWIQFDPKSQKIFGLPFEESSGIHEFQLLASDKEGKEVNDIFLVIVEPRPVYDRSVEFSMHIDTNYDHFKKDVGKKILVGKKLSSFFGDPSTEYLIVLSIKNGSVVYAWTNNTLPSDPCPKGLINELSNLMLEENGTISERLLQAMNPEFKISELNIVPLGSCVNIIDRISVSATPKPPKREPAVPGDDDTYITTIIPAVVIVILLIIAAMIAYFLYRRRRRGKMKMQDNGSFVNKGVPIIFADELDEKTEKPIKSPSTVEAEKLPSSGTENGKLAEEATQQTPLLSEISDGSPDVRSSPPYHGPQPTNRDNKMNQPKTTPNYRQPPPYVPP
ncbi:dystroglycan 1-like [Tachypleus tridentatus]|uniref:dystroglycan 1-like n=1 Tax=Tachypleus tridentatus TaxID=6853 RepID=UPI003FD12752